MIKDVKWNHDAADPSIIFVHLEDSFGKKLCIQIEKSSAWWKISHRSRFSVKVDAP